MWSAFASTFPCHANGRIVLGSSKSKMLHASRASQLGPAKTWSGIDAKLQQALADEIEAFHRTTKADSGSA